MVNPHALAAPADKWMKLSDIRSICAGKDGLQPVPSACIGGSIPPVPKNNTSHRIWCDVSAILVYQYIEIMCG
jgi:hypothetical protein